MPHGAPLQVSISQPIPNGMYPHGYIISVLIGIDVLVNAILGGRAFQTISSRIGESITAGTWPSWAWLPAWFQRHCLRSIYQTLV